jgi:WD40 repeat protein
VLMGLPDGSNTCSRTIFVGGEPSALAHWGDVIAVGLGSSSVMLLDAITGNTKSVLLGHTGTTLSLAFSLDGNLLVSGSEDKTVNLLDVPTGKIIGTFSDHASAVLAVSISPDRTTIASGTEDGTVRLWEVRTGGFYPTVFYHNHQVTAVSFSPVDSRRLISSSWDRTVRQWDIDGHRSWAPCHEAGRVSHVGYASDGTRFVSCGGAGATVRDSENGVVVVKLDLSNPFLLLQSCCFLPGDSFVACASAYTIYIWDTANSEAPLVGKFVGHSKPIISIASSSFLISASLDRSVKFWRSSGFSVDSDNTPVQLDSKPIESVHLFAEHDTVVTSDSSGEVKIWDLKTGRSAASFSTLAKGIRDTHVAGDTLVVVWWEGWGYNVWDVGNGKLLRTIRSSLEQFSDLRISEDGTKIFGLGGGRIEAWSIQTGEPAGRVKVQDVGRQGRLDVHGSKVWLTGSKDVGWDFGGREVSQFSLSTGSPDRPRLYLVDPSTNRGAKLAWIEDTMTGRAVFYLSKRFMRPGVRRRLDGRYLLVWSRSGEVVVIDLNCVFERGL